MTPERPGLHIAHDEGSFPEHPGNLEVELLVLDGPDIHDAIKAEMSPGRRNGPAPQLVIDDLAGGIGKHVDGIGPRLLSDHHAKNQLIVPHKLPGVPSGDDLWICDRLEGLDHLAGIEFFRRRLRDKHPRRHHIDPEFPLHPG